MHDIISALDPYLYWILFLAPALQIIFLVLAAKQRKPPFFCVSLVMGWIPIVYIALGLLFNSRVFDVFELLACAVMPFLYAIISQVAILLRIAVLDKVPSKLPWKVIWWVHLVLLIAGIWFLWQIG